MARALGLKVAGTIGILLRAKFQGKIERLMATGFWLSEELYEKVLREVGEV